MCYSNGFSPPRFLFFFSSQVQIKGRGGCGGTGGVYTEEVEKEKKGVNCLPIDNSIITL